ncbi:slit homolog 3 protein-like, partial [Oppia nitens]|uniref:slit homolog 3 protein-like n=1 Tax=Oppia nitens TaxID=1686743 RepID=UPI0023D9D08F
MQSFTYFQVFKFISIYILLIITLLGPLIICPTKGLSVSDICDYSSGQQVYCNCDNQGADEAREVTCFIIKSEGLNRSSSIWKGFKLQKNITSLIVTTRFDARITFIPMSALKNIDSSLQRLTINEMKFGHLERYAVNNLTQIEKIILENNEITGLNEYSFAFLPALKSLSIASNSLQVLKAKSLIHLPALESLFLDRNRLITIEDNAFDGLKSLKEIDLRLNDISVISWTTFNGLPSLKNLDLSRNRLKTIPENVFIGAPLLRELNLNRNLIESIDEKAFRNTSHLMSLLLSVNKLKHLSSLTFKESPNLVIIDLSENMLQTFESELISDLVSKGQQFVVYLRGNRLECDCHLLWLSDRKQNFSELLQRELRFVKCVFRTNIMGFNVDDEIKVLDLGRNESVRKSCSHNSLDFEDISDNTNNNHKNNDDSYENVIENKDNNNNNQSITQSEFDNKNDLSLENKKEILETKILSTELSPNVNINGIDEEIKENHLTETKRKKTMTDKSHLGASRERQPTNGSSIS